MATADDLWAILAANEGHPMLVNELWRQSNVNYRSTVLYNLEKLQREGRARQISMGWVALKR